MAVSRFAALVPTTPSPNFAYLAQHYAQSIRDFERFLNEPGAKDIAAGYRVGSALR